MQTVRTTHNRRSFFKVSAAAGGGMVLGFNWLTSCGSATELAAMAETFDINAYLRIAANGVVTIMSANPEVGQNIKTAMPMIVADELGVDWKDVIVEQAPLSKAFVRQVAGGSQSLRHSWKALRTAGATARQMLINAAASEWEVDPSTCRAGDSRITHPDGRSATYGELASIAADMPVPEEVTLKDPSEFTIIGKSKRNVDIDAIVTGKSLYGLDQKFDGMRYACVARSPAFGLKLTSYDDSKARSIDGVTDVLRFGDKVAVLATNTWAAMKGKKALECEYETDSALESTADHDAQMLALLKEKTAEPRRADGNVRTAFATADQVIERTYESPFLPHSCLEPMNFFAHVTEEKVVMSGPVQTPESAQRRVAELLNRHVDDVYINMTRQGGGFGRRLYHDFIVEAAEISSLAKVPVQVVFTREDDMAAGIYRPASKYTFKAALKNGQLTGYHLVGVGVNSGNVTREHNFPATAVSNYLVESHNLISNITIGAWRAPITNFLAYAEQSFLDEVAEALGKDAVEFRIELLEKAKKAPTGELHYDIDKTIGVMKLAASKSNWGKAPQGVYQGFSAYYSHNTYVAEVAEVVLENGRPKVTRVVCTADCGIVINPDSAANQMEGGVVDGVGHAMYGDFSFDKGRPMDLNFDTYRMIRMGESPKVEAYFVESTEDPTGLGEPSLPPAGGALANALYKATGQRLYSQPFVKNSDLLG